MLAAANALSSLDYVVVLIYLMVTIALGLQIGRKVKTGEDFFLGGRRLPWWAVGMSLVATDIGGTDIIGVGGAAYQHGMAVANFEWIGCIPAMIVGAFVFIPYFYRTGVYTVPEFLERRYDGNVRTVIATCWLIFMACNLGIMLLASGKMMSAVFGWPEVWCILVTALLVGLYTCTGGLEAVVYTDVIQCVVMIAGCLLILVIGLSRVGGFSGLTERLHEAEQRRAISSDSKKEAVDSDKTATQAGTLSDTQADPQTGTSSGAAAEPLSRTALILPVDTPTPYPWPGIYFGLALILSPAYWIGNQAIVQRSLGARSEFEAKASYIWGAVLKNLIPLIVAIPGLIAMALLPDLEDGDTAIPRLVAEILPSGIRGLFVAAFIAALMSSVDSYLNSASTIVSHDIYKRFFSNHADEKRMLNVGRITTVSLVIWAIVFALGLRMMNDKSGLYAIFQTLMAFFQGPAFAILLIGIFWKRATAAGALAGLICGIVTSVGLYSLNQTAVCELLGIPPLFRISEPFLYFSIWAFTVTATVLIGVSLITRAPSAEKSALVFGTTRK